MATIVRSKCRRVHIVGRKNSGKTTLVCDVVRNLSDRGILVATIKHTHHNHELDTPGKDSWRHRDAGASAVGILAAEMTAIFLPEPRSDNENERYRRLEAAMSGFDLILVEGDLHCAAPKLEVWRQINGDAPYCTIQNGIDAMVTDDRIDHDLRIIPRSDVNQVADCILNLAGIEN